MSRMRLVPVPLANELADYYELHLTTEGGRNVMARVVVPRGKKDVPLVLAFHDYNRGVRGWHHLTRYSAIGYAVAALCCSSPICDITSPDFAGYYEDAVALAHAASSLDGVSSHRLMACGDGMGAALAAAVAAALPAQVTRCAMLNPMPCAIRAVWEHGLDVGFYQGVRSYFRATNPTHSDEESFFAAMQRVDCLAFAPQLRCKLLLGSSQMDKTAPAFTHKAFYDAAACEKRMITFPKHDHELINFYENEQLKFLLEG